MGYGQAFIFAIGVLFFLIFVGVQSSKEQNLKKLSSTIKNVRNGKQISWDEVYSFRFLGFENIKRLIDLGIQKKALYGSINDEIEIEYESKFDTGSINERTDKISDYITKKSLEEADRIVQEKNFFNYGVIHINSSTLGDLLAGAYFYKFDKNSNLELLKMPIHYSKKGKVTVDYKLNEEIVKINSSAFKDYYVLGSEIVENNFKLDGSKLKPGVGTVFSEAFLGSSYATLSKLSNISIESKSSITDTRQIQVILENNQDIVFQGIDLYNELNRRFSDLKRSFHKEEKKLEVKESNIINELSELKKLLDNSVINKEEFAKLKKGIINRVNNS